MQLFYYADHHKHDPARLHRPDASLHNRYYSETAARGKALLQALKQAQLGPLLLPGEFGIQPITAVHNPEMVDCLKNAFERMQYETPTDCIIPETFRVGPASPHKSLSIWGQLGQYSFDTSSPIFKETWDVAYWTTQVALSAAAVVLAGNEQHAYALCRPPGHHATADMWGGFCYLNNVAIAANWLAEQGNRVAILDIDYHHGNGTQDIFYGRSDVLTCSIHADPLHEYPYYWGFADEFGTGSGKNYNFNYPLPLNCSPARYMIAFDEALNRIRQFVPDLLLISLGVDMTTGDPLGTFQLEENHLQRLGAKLAAFDLPTVVVQEGGYHLENLGGQVVAFLTGLTS